MEKWVPVALIAMLIVGSGGGYFFASSTYTPQIKTLQDQLAASEQQVASLNTSNQGLTQDKATLETSKAALQTQYDSLQSSYTALQSEHTTLQANYNALSSQYDTLQSGVDTGLATLSAQHVQLQKDYDDLKQMLSNNVYGTPGDQTMLNNYYKLSLAVRSLNSTLWEYCNVVNSFRNTLTEPQILKMEATVRSVIGSSTDAWANYQKIHEYITSNVKYVYDIDFPYIGQFWYQDVNGVRYLTDFKVGTIQNYVQTPEFTLQWKQGDCDDQAALEYAMLRYYNKYITGSDYTLYITSLDFGDTTSHMTVFMPVSGGQLTVLDPAGNYLTKNGSTIASKDPVTELNAYSSYWSSHGGITKITLYRVNLTDGSYVTVSEGNIAQTAAFLAK